MLNHFLIYTSGDAITGGQGLDETGAAVEGYENMTARATMDAVRANPTLHVRYITDPR